MDDTKRIIQNFLAHHGIKGMHWGIRRDIHQNEGNSPRVSQTKEDREYEHHASQIKSDLAAKGVDSERLKAKYGVPPKAGSSDRGGLTPGEKKALEVAGVAAGVAVVGAAGLAAYKLGLLQNPMLLENTAMKVYGAAKDTAITDMWTTGVDLPAGHIFTRIGTVAEKAPREHGFFAAHDAADIERYKAVLPVFWKQWGIGSPKAGGFVNNYKALVPIKAPTGQEATSLYAHLLKTDPVFRELEGLHHIPDRTLFTPHTLVQQFNRHSQEWAGDPLSPVAEKYFAAVKQRGFNALVDYNDAGRLAKVPMRIIDGNAFKIHSNEPLKYDEMRAAAKRVAKSLKHSYSGGGVMDVEDIIQNALTHHGVKGMHWGIRKDRSSRVTVVTDPTKKRKKIQTTGGHNLPAHGDAIKARTNQQRLSKSGTDALSNRQLQDLQTRLNLEQNVSRLHTQQRASTKPWIVRFIKDPTGRKQVRDAANSPAAKAGATYVKKSLVKKAATAAAVAAV